MKKWVFWGQTCFCSSGFKNYTMISLVFFLNSNHGAWEEYEEFKHRLGLFVVDQLQASISVSDYSMALYHPF